ncbi:7723_t:CDS:2 [Funneliformis mosseae]|uniref:7723_t:CDS:1 n=1 Tax=Funneliformis mosseae TaxID=27381 RepID=A0A9N9B418_FUNMO|nr:7723_t:CDS:2 [Funneliformis mosseae]
MLFIGDIDLFLEGFVHLGKRKPVKSDAIKETRSIGCYKKKLAGIGN